MKPSNIIHSRLQLCRALAVRMLGGGALASVLLLGGNTFAADDITFEPTGANTDILSANGHWQNDWGPAFATLVFEPTNPPPSGATAGSVFIQANWTAENTNGWDCKMSLWRGGWYDAPADNFDGAQYEYLLMDIKYDTNSTIPAAQANWDIGLEQGWAGTVLTNYSPAQDGSWQHLVIPIAANQPSIGSTCGVSFYKWRPGGAVGTMGIWVANVKLIARNVPIAPPTVALDKQVAPGLAMFADKVPSYLRGNVRTDTNGTFQLDWVGAATPANPVTYSWTIAQFPTAGHAGHRSDVVITPDPAGTLQDPDPDWSATNALWISVEALADGSVHAGVAVKTNEYKNNTQLYGPGRLTGGYTFAAPTAVGTWQIVFTNDTSLTLIAPNGAGTNVTIPADIAASYTNVSFFLISAMGNTANVGQSVTYSALDITGVGTPVHENFTSGALTSPFLVLQNQGYLFPWNFNPPSHRWVTPAARFWMKWNLPDNGFSPVSSPTLPGGVLDWLGRGLTNLFQNGSERWVLVSTNNLPAMDQSYLRLIKRAATQLQVLVPNETNAPGTVTGKTGTPATVSLGVDPIVNVIVNSTDAAWFVAGGAVGDTIRVELSPADPNAALPGDTTLANGTANFPIFFGTPGTYTITATNLTNPLMPNAVSSSITVTP